MFVVDIPCPSCGRSDGLRKLALGRYRCPHCDTKFDLSEVSRPER